MKRSTSTRISTRMRAVLVEICAYKAGHDGQAPTRRDLMRLCGFRSLSTVNYYLLRLESAGLIRTQNDGEARGIEVIGATWEPPADIAAELERVAEDARNNAEMAARVEKIVGLTLRDVADEAVQKFKATAPRYPQFGEIARGGQRGTR